MREALAPEEVGWALALTSACLMASLRRTAQLDPSPWGGQLASVAGEREGAWLNPFPLSPEPEILPPPPSQAHGPKPE